MNKFTVLYNPLAGKTDKAAIEAELSALLPDDELEYVVLGDGESYADVLKNVASDRKIMLSGGDGTLNRFVNDPASDSYAGEIWYYASGNGNDFWTDLGRKKGDAPVDVTGYLKNLPLVTVNGVTRKFINGIGYGESTVIAAKSATKCAPRASRTSTTPESRLKVYCSSSNAQTPSSPLTAKRNRTKKYGSRLR